MEENQKETQQKENEKEDSNTDELITKIIHNKTLNTILTIIRKDFFLILLCIIALGTCAYTIASVKTLTNECNQYWVNQMQKAGCSFTGNFYNKTIEEIMLDIPYINKKNGG